ncbi:hypothetical protein APHAL10511_002357 [Amanita phalloides]|nr:hypothetical protein APHAL10511_002357 [Amanita phalloides]
MLTSADSDVMHESTTSLASRQSDRIDQVDIARAEEEFYTLSRQLTARGEAAEKASKLSSSTKAGNDTEKANDEPDVFDLRDYLTSSNDANQKAGIRHKHVGVTWEDLQVDVAGGINSKFYAGTLGGAIINFFLAPVFWIWRIISRFLPQRQGPTRTILHKSSGVLKPGEMCLVLGCPGAGCSTFLKTIANKRDGFFVSGEVLYAGIDAQEMEKHYKGEVVYNMEDDIHIATLTVAQTLAFALSTKTPGQNGRLPGISKKQFNDEILDTVLRMLNISHTKQTLVGDAFVRGVSGGERKRVSIAEMMATRARVQCWDNSTRGLDASTALDFVKSLRIMTDVLGQTTFVTLYQAGEGIYDLFDKVLVLDQGRQVFCGPPKRARAYFEKLGYKALPRQTTADYLTGCTDVNERQFALGRSGDDVPSTPEELDQAYCNSPFHADYDVELQEYKLRMETEKTDQEAFRAAVAAEKRRGVSKQSPYTINFMGQVKALTKRQFQTKIQDKFHIYTSYSISTIMAFVIGAAYYNQPLTSNGAFTRGSVIFSAVLLPSLDAFSEMPLQMIGRPILSKQTSYSLYRPAAHALAKTIADIPFSASRIFIFNIIVYFLTGLHRSGAAFWTYHLIVYTAFLALQGLFRTLGLLCFNLESAFRLATVIVPNFVLYTGYMIPVHEMKRWLFWIFYINPVSYAFQACMENEFKRISLTCDGNSVVPRNGPGLNIYPDTLGPNQACTLFGAVGGSNIIRGADYLRVGFALDVDDLWRRDYLVLLGILILFQLAQVLAIELYPQYGFNLSINIFTKENAETRKLNAAQREKEARQTEKIDEEEGDNQDIDLAHHKTFTWETLNYHVPGPNGSIRLLHDVFGYVKPGTLTALMGASGAGKTTCLDVLAQRKNIGVVTGNILVDGRSLSSDFARGTAYAEQMDVHESTATVREALRFSAYLRQPASVSREEKDAYVEEIIRLLELQDLTEALVFSLSAEARKRLTIGVELASKPELLLFLDEPTSGLDAQSAWNLVRFLRKLANQGQAILCTIHQPSSLLFESFDRLLLLEQGGETVYFGDIGPDSVRLREYFARHGAKCPPNVNPAEYMLEAIGAGVTPRVGDRDWKDVWLESPEFKDVKEEIQEIKAAGQAKPADEKRKITTCKHFINYATPFWYQLQEVVKRNNLALWRSPEYIFTRIFICGAISLFVSLTFLQLGHSVRDLQYRVFAVFWLVVLPIIIMTQIEPLFIRNRGVFIRESACRMYSPYVFAIGQLLGEIPYNVLCSLVYWVFMVYPMGFGKGAAGINGTGFQLLIVIIMMLFGVSLGQLIAAISPSVQVAVLFNPFTSWILNTFCGVTIPYPTMIEFWRSWMYPFDPFTRSMAAAVSTELHGLVITCKSDEYAIFNPPAGETCSQWAQPFVDTFGGYIQNLNATSNCQYCQYKVGEEFFVPLNISYDNRWRDIWIVFAFFIFNLILTIIASRFLRYAKR